MTAAGSAPELAITWPAAKDLQRLVMAFPSGHARWWLGWLPCWLTEAAVRQNAAIEGRKLSPELMQKLSSLGWSAARLTRYVAANHRALVESPERRAWILTRSAVPIHLPLATLALVLGKAGRPAPRMVENVPSILQALGELLRLDHAELQDPIAADQVLWNRLITLQECKIPVILAVGDRQFQLQPLDPETWQPCGPVWRPSESERGSLQELLPELGESELHSAWDLQRRALGLPLGEIGTVRADERGPVLPVKIAAEQLAKRKAPLPELWIMLGNGDLRGLARVEITGPPP